MNGGVNAQGQPPVGGAQGPAQQHYEVREDASGTAKLYIGGKACTVKIGGEIITDKNQLQRLAMAFKKTIADQPTIQQGQVWKLSTRGVTVFDQASKSNVGTLNFKADQTNVKFESRLNKFLTNKEITVKIANDMELGGPPPPPRPPREPAEPVNLGEGGEEVIPREVRDQEERPVVPEEQPEALARPPVPLREAPEPQEGGEGVEEVHVEHFGAEGEGLNIEVDVSGEEEVAQPQGWQRASVTDSKEPGTISMGSRRASVAEDSLQVSERHPIPEELLPAQPKVEDNPIAPKYDLPPPPTQPSPKPAGTGFEALKLLNETAGQARMQSMKQMQERMLSTKTPSVPAQAPSSTSDVHVSLLDDNQLSNRIEGYRQDLKTTENRMGNVVKIMREAYSEVDDVDEEEEQTEEVGEITVAIDGKDYLPKEAYEYLSQKKTQIESNIRLAEGELARRKELPPELKDG